MGRWISEECGKITDDTGAFLGRANTDEDAKNLCSDHAADCDAHEARIAELESDRDSETRWACQYKAERDALKPRIKQLECGIAEERKANSKLLDQNKRLAAQVSQYLEENNRLDGELDELREANRQIGVERNQLLQQRDEAIKIGDSLRANYEEASQQLRYERGRLDSLVDAVPEHFTPENSYLWQNSLAKVLDILYPQLTETTDEEW